MSNPGVSTLSVSVDGNPLPARSAIDFRSSRRKVYSASDDGSTIHVGVEDIGNDPPIGFGRIKFDPTGTYATSVADVQQRKYDLFITQTAMAVTGNDTANAATELATNNSLRAANNRVRILMYRVAVDMGAANAGNTAFLQTAQQTPEMYLYDTLGAQWTYFNGNNAHAQMDIGDLVYQTAAANRAAAMCVAGGYDGIFIDNVLANPIANGYYNGPNRPATGTLGSDANYNAAWDAFAKVLKQVFDKNGLTVVMGNAGGTLQNANSVAAWKSHFDNGFDGVLDESWMSAFSTTAAVFFPATDATVDTDGQPVALQAMQLAEYIKPPKFVALHSYLQGVQNGGNNVLVMKMAMAGALLFDNCIFIVDNQSDATGVAPLGYTTTYAGRAAGPWLTYYDRARKLGKPVSQRMYSGNVWVRFFQNGVVLLNNNNGNNTEPITGLTLTAHTGTILLYGAGKSAPAFGATITPSDPTIFPYQRTVFTSNAAAVIANPPNTPDPTEFQQFVFEIHNVSGGALTAITWGTQYVFPVALTYPATTKSRRYNCQWNGTNWIVRDLDGADF